MERSATALIKTACLSALTLFGVSFHSFRSGAAKSDANAGAPAKFQTSPRGDSQQPRETVVPAPSEFKEVFVGSIDKYAIRMELERQGADLAGYYFYERGAVQEALILQGRIDGEGNVTLAETSYETGSAGSPKKTGEFKGKLDGLSASGAVTLRFSGSWTGGKDGKQMTFGLREEVDFTKLNFNQLQFDLGGLKLSKKRGKFADKKLCYTIETEAPLLVGGDAARTEPFNRAVAGLVDVVPFIKEIRETHAGDTQGDTRPCNLDGQTPDSAILSQISVNYEVTAADKDFISAIFYFHEYGGGGTGTHWSGAFNYDLNRNAAIKLADLFTPNSKYLRIISAYSIRELRKLDEIKERLKMYADTEISLKKGAGPKIENFRSWNIISAGLKITFDPYQVGQPNRVFCEVVIPYSVLKPIIKPDGLLAKFSK